MSDDAGKAAPPLTRGWLPDRLTTGCRMPVPPSVAGSPGNDALRFRAPVGRSEPGPLEVALSQVIDNLRTASDAVEEAASLPVRGRRAEQERLTQWVRRHVHRNGGGVLWIEGPAGAGRSRMLACAGAEAALAVPPPFPRWPSPRAGVPHC
ncbi:hypothetical protein GCM10010121_045310 [Streptomyces brasiliensis]|uniref:Uncharacterized protein n=1 Tax=Streptomyces brasiliensis TaxID=1954 RepID=A0A917NVG3_9ACTN|nr:hypothetical protein GCM10010121_045310 [Streptomyces brasiliensis]